MKRTTLLMLALVAMLAAACSSDQQGGSGAASASTAASTAASESAEPSEAASEAPSDAPSEAAQPSANEGAGSLAAVLPEEVGGITLEYQSLEGEEVMGAEGITEEALAFFEAVGADASDLSSAIGLGFDQEGNAVSIVAFRVGGAQEDQLREEFLATLEEESGTVATERTLGGKDVLALDEDEAGVATGGYMYVSGDIVFLVGGSPEALAEEALSKLP